MANLTSRLIISLIDQASGPARGIVASMRTLHNSARTAPFTTMARQANKAGQSLRSFGGSAAAAGFGIYSFVTAMKDWNEAEFGFTFARIPDHFKGLRLDMESLNKDTQGATSASRKLARELGLLPSEVQKARTEVEKVGATGALGDSMWRAALGLTMADKEMPSDMAAKYLNAMYQSYGKQRQKLMKRMGVDESNQSQVEWFNDNWLKSVAAKSGFAAAKSALDPAELVSGARQYAPQWASLGMSPEIVLGALAHGSNFGFMAPELGTAFKSWGNRLVKPTITGLGWMNGLKMDRGKWSDGYGAADPSKATTRLDGLLSNQLYAGKGGKEFRKQIRAELDRGLSEGTTTSPEFQGNLTKTIQKRLGKGWEGRADDVADAVVNATTVAGGDVNIVEFIREGLKKGMTRAAMLEILEGKHVARNTPLFEYFDALVKMIDDLDKLGENHFDAIQEARRKSRAGKMDAMAGAWEEVMISLQDSGVIDTLTNGLRRLAEGISSLSPGTLESITYGLMGLAVIGPLGALAAGAAAGLGALYAAILPFMLAAGMGTKGAAAAGSMTGAAAGTAGVVGLGVGAAYSGDQEFRSQGYNGMPGWMMNTIGRALGFPDWGLSKTTPTPADRLGWGAGLNQRSTGAPGDTIATAGPAVASGQAGSPTASAAQSAVNQADSVFSSAAGRFEAAGRNAAEAFANGIRSGIGAISSAAQDAAAAATMNAARGSFGDVGR